jgi:hypothetical protein
MECSKKESWFSTIKVKTIPAAFGLVKLERIFVTQKTLEKEEEETHNVSPGRNLHKD